MIFFPNAKINLGLHVISKRIDGYHEIETVFLPVPWHDVLEINLHTAKGVRFKQTGIKLPGVAATNLCVKAYEKLASNHKFGGVNVHLHKTIPAGAGLGGGSSDAAFTLLGLNKLLNLKLSNTLLQKYASELGSDCAFFIRNKPLLATGRGEILEDIPVDLKDYFLVIVKPPISISTKEAYNGIVPATPELPIRDILKNPVMEWRHILKNDFEKTILKKYPAIRKTKDNLYSLGALYASMSGSGSAVYGIFEKEPDINIFKPYTVWKGPIG